METSAPLDNDFGQELELSGEIRSFLKETAKWAKLLAIVGFVVLGLMALSGLMMGTFMGSVYDAFPQDDISAFPIAGMSTFFALAYILIALLYFFPMLYLYRFATRMQRALKTDDQQFLTEAFSNLKSVYKFFGILVCIIIGIYALFFVAGILMSIVGSTF